MCWIIAVVGFSVALAMFIVGAVYTSHDANERADRIAEQWERWKKERAIKFGRDEDE